MKKLILSAVLLVAQSTKDIDWNAVKRIKY